MDATPSRSCVTSFVVSTVLLASTPGLAASTAGAKTASRPLPQVINGQDVKDGDYPSTVAFRYKTDNTPFCTGTVVADYWVLTAAHCFRNTPTFYITTGVKYSPDLTKIESDSLHGNNLNVDVVLVKTKDKVTSASVKIVRLEPSVRPTDNTAATAVGWGRISDTPPQKSTTLRQADVKVIACESYPNYVCTMPAKKGSFTTFGDSGGPLYIGSATSPTQVGIYGGVLSKADQSFGYVFTGYVYQWIIDTIYH